MQNNTISSLSKIISLLAPWLNLLRLAFVQVDCHEDIYSFLTINFPCLATGYKNAKSVGMLCCFVKPAFLIVSFAEKFMVT